MSPQMAHSGRPLRAKLQALSGVKQT